MNTTDISHIRNFSIVAHIDHGKSTISDRILELTHTVEERDLTKQMLDSMDIEQERGITIKSNAVRVTYDADDGETYQFNLIDTPGHVDFTYEVSRSLAACEGAVLVVDATQGVEAQTVSNANLAMNADLDIVPCINKIDLPSAHPDEVKEEIEEDLAIPAHDAVCVSGKTGEGIHDLLEAIVFLISPPKGDASAPLKALILDSYFDDYRGVVAYVRVFDGRIVQGDQLTMMQTGEEFLVDGVGCKRPAEVPLDVLGVGEVGFVVTGLKDPESVHVGDTLTYRDRPCDAALPGYREAKPMVYTGVFPVDNKEYENLRDALEKLHVNDPSLVWTPETSVALGFGFRVGFLGLLHMEVVKERLEREFDLDLIATSPSVDYHVYKTDGTMLRDCETAYVGGGTPTLLGTGLGELVRRVRGVAPVTELTCEANPDSLADEVIEAVRAAGGTRLSIGVQSLDDDELSRLGRIHSAVDARDRVRAAVASGLAVSCDLMCATPGQTGSSWERTLRETVLLGVGHISVYPLMIEEGTALSVRVGGGSPAWNDEDVEAARMFWVQSTRQVTSDYGVW